MLIETVDTLKNAHPKTVDCQEKVILFLLTRYGS